MKKVFAFVLTVLGSLFCVCLYAQDSTAATPLIGSIFTKVPSWVWPSVLGLYEVLVRVVPTAKNWSILSFVIKMIQFILPNKSTVMQAKNPNTHE
jgi:hypothetical protein